MAKVNIKTKCFTCGKDKITYDCKGCLQSFCFEHLGEHRKELDQKFDDIENERNLLKQTLNQYHQHTSQHPLLKQINQWEEHSIRLIRQTAEDARTTLQEHTNQQTSNIQVQLKYLTDEMKELRSENEFNEIHLIDLKTKLEKLEEQLNQPKDIEIEEGQTLIKKINISISAKQPNLPVALKWNLNAITVAGGNGEGGQLNQLSYPFGITIDNDGTIYVADQNNHRIVEWKKEAQTGKVVAGGNGNGSRTNQFSSPMHVIIDHHTNSFIIADLDNKRVVQWPRRNGQSGETIISNVSCWGLFINRKGDIYVCDCQKHEVRKWKIGDWEGTLVAGGNGKGNGLHQFDSPHCVFIDDNESVYVTDCMNDRVMKWTKGAKEGIVVAGGQGRGDKLTQLASPQGIFVDRSETLYVAEYKNHRVTRWLKGSKEGEIVIGGNGQGNEPDQLNSPTGLAFDKDNNLYVTDQENTRVQKSSMIA